MNWKLELLIMNIFFIFCALIMGYFVFTTGNAPVVLREDPTIYYLVLGTGIFSALLSLIGINLQRINFAKSEQGEDK
jgi:hypothetical protein